MMITEVKHVLLVLPAMLVDNTITIIAKVMSIVEELIIVDKILLVVSYQSIATRIWTGLEMMHFIFAQIVIKEFFHTRKEMIISPVINVEDSISLTQEDVLSVQIIHTEIKLVEDAKEILVMLDQSFNWAEFARHAQIIKEDRWQFLTIRLIF